MCPPPPHVNFNLVIVKRDIYNFDFQTTRLSFQTKNFAVQYYLKNACKGLGQIPAEERLVRDIYLDGTKLNTTAMLSSDGKKGSNRRQVGNNCLKSHSLSTNLFQIKISASCLSSKFCHLLLENKI